MKNMMLVVAVLMANVAAGANRPPQGGGVIYPAWTAQYFDNAKLEGKPRWEQSQVRVRFDWEDWRPVVGSNGETIRTFPTDNFSIRFTAQLIVRFDEEYTFKLVSDEGARLKIKPAEANEWMTVIDAWAPHQRHADTAKLKLKPGVKYDVVLEYYDLTGDAVCQLFWSSPSTPEEVVDYASAATTRHDLPGMYADWNMQGAGNREEPCNSAKMGDSEVDESGWPKGDFSYALSNGYACYGGRFRLVFNGLAQVEISGASFIVDGKPAGNTLPKGAGYDAKSNRTTAFFDRDPETSAMRIIATRTQRSAGSPVGSGVTHLYVMLPKRKGSTETHEPGEMANGEARHTWLPVFAWRNQPTGLNDIVEWKDRTDANYARIHGKVIKNDMSYEKLVAISNELGRDLHLCFGGSINEEFMHKLALLTKYGSDGVEPYTQPTKNPVWPPLNSNLRLYLEHGNEMGWSAIQPRAWIKDFARIKQEQRAPIWPALNFDGKADESESGGVFRYHAYRTVRMSENMRAVWGDAAMGETIRVCLFGQYERAFQNSMCQFIDDYWNNGSGNWVKDPHPVSYFIWGTGPASYYGSLNMWGESDKVWFKDGSFEDNKLQPGTAVAAPAGGVWKFEGNAGVVDVRYPRAEAVTAVAATDEKTKAAGLYGFKFTVGPKDIYVYDLGRVVRAGDKGGAIISIWAADGGNVINEPSVRIALSKDVAGKTLYEPLRYNAWPAAGADRVGHYRLEAGKSYIVVSEEAKGATVAGPASKLTAAPGITIDGPVSVAATSARANRDLREKILSQNAPGTGYGQVNFHFTTQVLEPVAGAPVIPPDPSIDPRISKGYKGATIPRSARLGTQMAFIAGQGAISQTITIDQAGEYFVVITGACGHLGANPLNITIGEHNVWKNELLRGKRKPQWAVYNYGTRYVRLEPGQYTVRIAGTKGDAKAVAYIDSVQLGSIEAFAGGPECRQFLGSGTATGETAGPEATGKDPFSQRIEICTSMSLNWGTVPFVYEGGTNAGGDWNGGNVFYPFQFKWEHPWSITADNQWARIWNDYGGYNNMYYYDGYQDIATSDNDKPWQAAIGRAQKWLIEPVHGLKIPGTVTPADPHVQGEPASTYKGYITPYGKKGHENTSPKLAAGQWKSWIVLAPSAREYRLQATSAGAGTVRLSVDDATVVAKGAAGSPLSGTAFLTKGMHTIKVKCDAGEITVDKVDVK